MIANEHLALEPDQMEALGAPDLSISKDIYMSSVECMRRYKSLIGILKGVDVAQAKQFGYDLDATLFELHDAWARFKVWGTNIAAFQIPSLRSSLEFRLEEATEIRGRILKILGNLQVSLYEASLIITGKEPNESWPVEDNSDSEGENIDSSHQDAQETSELNELFKAMKGSNSNLMKLSVVIRHSPSRDDYLKAATRYYFNPVYDIGHVREKYGSGKESVPWLVERLGKAVTRRRQWLKYREEHHGKLTRDWDETALAEKMQNEGEEKTVAFTKATTFVDHQHVQMADDGIDLTGSFGSQTSYEQTVAGELAAMNLHVPDYPKMAFPGSNVPFEFGQPFQCPFCFTEQVVKHRTAWKKHVFRDLRPYVCTFKECDLKMFRSRNEWFAHEVQNHRREWICQSCQHEPFHSSGNYEAHLKSEHHVQFEGSQLRALILQSEEPIDRVSSKACRLCDEWETSLSGKMHGTRGQFRRHLGRHMEQLALFALPRNEDEQMEDDSREDDSMSDGFSETDSLESEEADKVALAEDRASAKVSTDSGEAASRSGLETVQEEFNWFTFIDAIGRKRRIVFEHYGTWADMEVFIKESFSDEDALGSFVRMGNYDLLGPDGEMILPQTWESMIKPDMQIIMQMWPIANAAVESDMENLDRRWRDPQVIKRRDGPDSDIRVFEGAGRLTKEEFLQEIQSLDREGQKANVDNLEQRIPNVYKEKDMSIYTEEENKLWEEVHFQSKQEEAIIETLREKAQNGKRGIYQVSDGFSAGSGPERFSYEDAMLHLQKTHRIDAADADYSGPVVLEEHSGRVPNTAGDSEEESSQNKLTISTKQFEQLIEDFEKERASSSAGKAPDHNISSSSDTGHITPTSTQYIDVESGDSETERAVYEDTKLYTDSAKIQMHTLLGLTHAMGNSKQNSSDTLLEADEKSKNTEADAPINAYETTLAESGPNNNLPIDANDQSRPYQLSKSQTNNESRRQESFDGKQTTDSRIKENPAGHADFHGAINWTYKSLVDTTTTLPISTDNSWRCCECRSRSGTFFLVASKYLHCPDCNHGKCISCISNVKLTSTDSGELKLAKVDGSKVSTDVEEYYQGSSSRVIEACLRCDAKNQTCDGGRPSCANCENAGTECTDFDPITKRDIPRRRRRFTKRNSSVVDTEHLQARTNELELTEEQSSGRIISGDEATAGKDKKMEAEKLYTDMRLRAHTFLIDDSPTMVPHTESSENNKEDEYSEPLSFTDGAQDTIIAQNARIGPFISDETEESPTRGPEGEINPTIEHGDSLQQKHSISPGPSHSQDERIDKPIQVLGSELRKSFHTRLLEQAEKSKLGTKCPYCPYTSPAIAGEGNWQEENMKLHVQHYHGNKSSSIYDLGGSGTTYIPPTRDAIPPPLPPPRHIAENDDLSADLEWQWKNSQPETDYRIQASAGKGKGRLDENKVEIPHITIGNTKSMDVDTVWYGIPGMNKCLPTDECTRHRLGNEPRVKEGEFDIDGFNRDLQKKAQYSENGGAMISESDFSKVMESYLMKGSASDLSTDEHGSRRPKRASPNSPGIPDGKQSVDTTTTSSHQTDRVIESLHPLRPPNPNVTTESEPSSYERTKSMKLENIGLERERTEEIVKTSGLEEAGIEEVAATESLKHAFNTESPHQKSDTRPVYTRMSRRHLSVETLDAHKIDYEFDVQDPEYVLIKRWVPEDEQDRLWAHTKHLRETRIQDATSVDEGRRR